MKSSGKLRLGVLLLVSASALAACSEDTKTNGSSGGAGTASSGTSAGGASGQSGKSSGGSLGGKQAGGEGGAGEQAGSNAGGKAGSSVGGNAGAAAGGHAGTPTGGTSAGDAAGGSDAGASGSADDGGAGGADSAPPECGNGVVEAGEECEPKSSSVCSESCLKVSTQACVDCEQAGACAEYSTSCADLANEDERSICYAVLKCVYDSNCADGVAELKHCFCGALNTADCSAAPNQGAGAPQGACAGLIRESLSDGANVATNQEVLARFIEQGYPGGAALARVNCDKLDATCIATCGYGN